MEIKELDVGLPLSGQLEDKRLIIATKLTEALIGNCHHSGWKLHVLPKIAVEMTDELLKNLENKGDKKDVLTQD